jgi:hypothetical protein
MSPEEGALAETARFELAVRVTPYDSLANCWFQPLTHVSELMAKRAIAGDSTGINWPVTRDFSQFGALSTLSVAMVIAVAM